jgi:hypothetical protein
MHADLPISAILRKAHAQLLRLLQMGQTCSLPFAQRFNLPLGHPALQASGNSAAVESFAGSAHTGKYGVAEVVTVRHSKELGVLLTSQHAARLVAVLAKEGAIEVVTNDEQRKAGGRGRRTLRVRFPGH